MTLKSWSLSETQLLAWSSTLQFQTKLKGIANMLGGEIGIKNDRSELKMGGTHHDCLGYKSEVSFWQGVRSMGE